MARVGCVLSRDSAPCPRERLAEVRQLQTAFDDTSFPTPICCVLRVIAQARSPLISQRCEDVAHDITYLQLRTFYSQPHEVLRCLRYKHSRYNQSGRANIQCSGAEVRAIKRILGRMKQLANLYCSKINVTCNRDHQRGAVCPSTLQCPQRFRMPAYTEPELSATF